MSVPSWSWPSHRPVAIFFDEIDVVRSLPFPTDELFAGIRELYNRRSRDPALTRLSFCLIGVAQPTDLIRDPRITPFNIGRRIELTDFTAAEAAPLTKGLPGDPEQASRLLARILYWTGGHPYLTQRLCRAVAEDGKVTSPRGVDRVCEGLFFTVRARDQEHNLKFVSGHLLRAEADRAALLDLYRRVRERRRVRDDPTNHLLAVLRLSGVVRTLEGLLGVRNRIYFRAFDRDWIQANLPDAEIRRQRAAYRRGLTRMGMKRVFSLDAHDEPMIDRDKVAIAEADYDDRANQIEWAYFDTEGKPALHKDGYQRRTFVYDKLGRRIGQVDFGLDGSKGVAMSRYRFETKGDKSKRPFSTPTAIPLGCVG